MGASVAGKPRDLLRRCTANAEPCAAAWPQPPAVSECGRGTPSRQAWKEAERGGLVTPPRRRTPRQAARANPVEKQALLRRIGGSGVSFGRRAVVSGVHIRDPRSPPSCRSEPAGSHLRG